MIESNYVFEASRVAPLNIALPADARIAIMAIIVRDMIIYFVAFLPSLEFFLYAFPFLESKNGFSIIIEISYQRYLYQCKYYRQVIIVYHDLT